MTQAVGLDDFLTALDLPVASRVDQRVPKKLLLDNGAPTATDKRHINDGIDELTWLAALKPTNIGVPAFSDEVRDYQEIAVLRVVLRAEAKAARIIELVHRAIPYPVLLLSGQGDAPNLSAAHKRRSQSEAGKTVLDGEVVTTAWDAARDADCWNTFRAALPLGRQPHATLFALFQGWIDALLALHAARVTGRFAIAANDAGAAARREALREYALLDAEIARLRSAAEKEPQMARQVALNLEMKRAEAARAAARARL